ncbi:LysM peptidoglycan-binding domain-containing protein (plasmid) [Aneurinibacillus sp. Ricciae_BoGa-3]|uniref:SAF domain-containing protein n=1 Tax=Aneurinibacillus sp. Ricciae_BoGa-3 TaxID=3022697 RepID=UPI0023415052|nr:SAF domain-containing protein [Aneurinibacillus sp. Ricciae_BoGa-3]WCK57698.1 LysM peptidoglycan-binding domain-containing protein [Aneurinibacillus sp. Ricciae_BoGa-3]
MNDKRYKTAIGSIVGLLALSGGLFAYQNVYVAKQQQANKATIYLANKDITAHTALSPDMFQAVQIGKDSFVPGYVDNMNGIVGKQLKGGLLKGEPLTAQRLETKKASSEGNLLVKIAPAYSSELKVGDKIRVYVRVTSRETNSTTTYFLFEKTVVQIMPPSSNSGDVIKVPTFQVHASDKEVQLFYDAQKDGDIAVTTVDELDSTKINSEKNYADTKAQSLDGKVYDPTTANPVGQNGGANSQSQAVMTYQVQTGDTLSSMALKFKTSNYAISALNNSRTNFKAGETINVPAN